MGKGPRLLLDICKHVGADTYLSGMFGKEYLDCAEFAAEGLNVMFHQYECRPYPQPHGDFVPFLSYLDVLFNSGLDRDQALAGGAWCPFVMKEWPYDRDQTPGRCAVHRRPSG